MARAFFAAALFSCVLSAQKPPQPAQTPQEPPEEDESLAPKVYALNPVQAKKEIVAGDYYFKKPNYLEATRWDPGSAEAFLKLGESREKLRQYGPAREAYSKYIELAEDPKEKDAIRKKMDKWPDAKSHK